MPNIAVPLWQAQTYGNQIPLVRGLPLIPRENRKEFENE